MKKDNKHLGTAVLLSKKEVVVSLPTTIVMRYTCGSYGVDENANLMIAWRQVSDWEAPQFTDPKAYGYSTVKTSAKNVNFEITCGTHPYYRPFNNAFKLKVKNGFLFEGDTVDIVLGDTSQGSPGLRTQSFIESAHQYKFLIDPFNTNKFAEIPNPVIITVVNGPPNEIHLVAPSIVGVDEEFSYTLRIIDEWGNPCADFCGDIEIKSPDGAKLIEKVTMTPENKGFCRVGGNKITREGTYHFRVVCAQEDLESLSNPCVCKSDAPYKLFWADMHGQTDYTVGTGSIDEYLSFAKGPGAVDVTGVQGNDFELNRWKWQDNRDKVKKYNKEGEFLVYLGYEWSGTNAGGGDHNVYFLNDSESPFVSSHWLEDDNIAEGDKFDIFPLNKLCEKYRGRKDVMIVPHIGGRPANLDFFDTELMSNIEIHSHHGTFEWFAHEAMKRKIKTGFIGTSDDHTCRPGLSYALQSMGQEVTNMFDTKSGLTAIYARELTREAIWEALRARRCYAVTFNRILLDVKVNGAIMGQEIECSSPPKIEVEAIGDQYIDHIDIYRGNDLIYQKYYYTTPAPSRFKTIKILWSGVRNNGRSKQAPWHGSVFLEKGKIKSAETVAFDVFQQGITYRANQVVSWNSATSGDYDGIILSVDAPEDAVLRFVSRQISLDIPLSGIEVKSKIYPAGGVNLKVEVSLLGEKLPGAGGVNNRIAETYVDADYKNGFGAYWVKVVQENGQMAFSSPVFINAK